MQRSGTRRCRTMTAVGALAGVMALIFGVSRTAFSMPSCLSRASVGPDGLARLFGAPLDRTVTINEADIPLRDALDRVAAASRVSLTYSADLLPRDRRVCLNFQGVSAGVVLTELLRSTLLRPLVIDADNVVLTPSRGPTASEPAPEQLNTVSQLDRIVVTGTADGAKQRSSPFALDVIDGGALMRSDAGTLSAALDGAVPGLWMWSQSPASTVGRFGSVRGASSFGVTSPKIYIDGIEVANPLVLTQFDPERVDRVEVIRGPQGAALYGADAISGVVNIITRHDGARAGEPLTVVRSRAGYSASEFAASGAFVQDHSIGVRTGTGRRSFGLGVSAGTVGDYIPGGAARSLLADGDVRFVGARSFFTGIARFAAKDAGTMTSPLLSGVPRTMRPDKVGADPGGMEGIGTVMGRPLAAAAPADSTGGYVPRTMYGGVADSTQSVRQYTVGTTTTFMPSARWTYTLVAGADGYRMNGVTTEGMPVRKLTDSIAPAAHRESDRTTLSVRAVSRFGAEDATATTLTLGAEHAATRQQFDLQNELRGGALSLAAVSLPYTQSLWSNTAGVLAQVNSSLRNEVFLSAGGRLERTTGLVSPARMTFLPMLGAAYVHEWDGQSLKLRASYGRGIRPASSALRAATWMNGQQAGGLLYQRDSRLARGSVRSLEPESQAGVEFGADMAFGRALSLHVTRFDQQATGLIQAVALPASRRLGSTGAGDDITYELQNVGAISNRGWELQGRSMVGRFSLQAGASFVDSRVQRVALRYGGELQRGDRMLEVPARTFSLQAGYFTSRWTTSWTLTRAMDWINYDQLRLAEQRQTAGFDARMVTGPRLREYWTPYDGATRVRGNVSFALSRGLALVMTGDNLLNIQLGEPDNITVIPGRTLTAGLRTRF